MCSVDKFLGFFRAFVTGKDAEEGSNPADESAQVRKVRGHVLADVLERRVHPAQSASTLLQGLHLRKSKIISFHHLWGGGGGGVFYRKTNCCLQEEK